MTNRYLLLILMAFIISPANAEDLVFFKTPYALLLEAKFTVSSRELAEQILTNDQNYLPPGKTAQITQILSEKESKTLRFRFMDISLKEYKIEKHSGQFDVINTQKISISPLLKNSTEAAAYLKKYVNAKPHVLYLVLRLGSEKFEEPKK